MFKGIIRTTFIKLPITFLIISVLWVLLYKVVPVRWTPLMLKRKIENIDDREYRNHHRFITSRSQVYGAFSSQRDGAHSVDSSISGVRLVHGRAQTSSSSLSRSSG